MQDTAHGQRDEDSVKIGALLQQGQQKRSRLQKLLSQASDQEIWSAELRAVLPPRLAPACTARALTGPVLTVTCSNSSAATQMRILCPEVVSKLKNLPHFSSLKEISVLVASR